MAVLTHTLSLGLDLLKANQWWLPSLSDLSLDRIFGPFPLQSFEVVQVRTLDDQWDFHYTWKYVNTGQFTHHLSVLFAIASNADAIDSGETRDVRMMI